VPALVLLGWGLAGIGSDLGYLAGDGWGSLFIGVGLLVAWGLGRTQRVRREWALIVGIVLGAIGLAEVADSLPFDADLAVIIPLAMIAVGLYLVARDRVPGRA
jgi:sulfite exporter TauE/SafE